jgi:putative Holliday junction resolvase
MRLVGVDFGQKRIGIAVGEREYQICSPRPLLSASGKLQTDAENIKKIVQKEQAHAVVLGIPYQPEGFSDRKLKVFFELAAKLQAMELKVYTIDESLTSLEAESDLRQSAKTARGVKKMRDSEAACKILERFFDQYASSKEE